MRIDEKDILNVIINKDKTLTEKISESIKELFNSEKLTTAFSSDIRQIKYFVFEGKSFIFDSLDGHISVYLSQKIKHNSILSDINIKNIKNENKTEIYLPSIFKINQSYIKFKKTPEQLKEALDLMIQKNLITQEKANDIISYSKQTFNDTEYNFSNDIYSISLFIKFLKSESYLDSYSHDSLIFDFMNQSAELLKDKFFYLSSSIKNMIECSQKEDLKSYNTSAEFNDGDNHLWITPLNNLVMSEQTMLYCFCFNDINNYDIYMLDTEEYPKELYSEYEENYSFISFREFLVLNLEQRIKKNDIIGFDDKVFSLVDNKVTFINPLFFYYLFSSFKHFVAFLKEHHNLQENYPEDVYSYNYQRKYYKHKYNYNEFQFLCQSFLTLGGGFDYDEQKGILITSDIEYIHNLPEIDDKPVSSIKQIPYLYPKEVSFLNKDWIQGLNYLVEQLEINKPDFVGYDTRFKNKEEAFKKSIAYMKKIIKKNS